MTTSPNNNRVCLPNAQWVLLNDKDMVIEFGFHDEYGDDHVAYVSCQLPVLPSQEEVSAIATLLMGGADWGDINCLLLSLADEKRGTQNASRYRVEMAREIARNWSGHHID